MNDDLTGIQLVCWNGNSGSVLRYKADDSSCFYSWVDDDRKVMGVSLTSMVLQQCPAPPLPSKQTVQSNDDNGFDSPVHSMHPNGLDDRRGIQDGLPRQVLARPSLWKAIRRERTTVMQHVSRETAGYPTVSLVAMICREWERRSVLSFHFISFHFI
jgi:hypothetical protein